MLVFAMLPPLLSFIAAGCIAFFLCVTLPRCRRYALGALVWFIALGALFPAAFFPNIVLVGRLTEKHLHAHIPLNAAAVEHVKSVALFNGIAVIVIASALTLAHGFVVRRLTPAVFRVYATAVALSTAIALAWSICVTTGVLSGSNVLGVVSGLCVLALTLVSRYVYSNAALFRGVPAVR